MSEAFFLPDGDDWIATELTRGPWSRDHQHGGPPSALLVRAVESLAGDDRDARTLRVTVDFLKPVPIGPLRVQAQLLRPGRSVRLFGASLTVDGEEVMRAQLLRVRRKALGVSAPPPTPAPVTPPDPSRIIASDFFPFSVGYHTAVDICFGRGRFGEGDAAAWIRMRHPLVPGEEPSPEQRALLAADAGSGVASALDHRRYLFVNTDLAVYFYRPPAGEWICVDARTVISDDGTGLAESLLRDERGACGRGLQSLFVDEMG